MENITEKCSNDIACDKYKLFIPTGNYVSPEYLAEEMRSSIDNFEKGFSETSKRSHQRYF